MFRMPLPMASPASARRSLWTGRRAPSRVAAARPVAALPPGTTLPGGNSRQLCCRCCRSKGGTARGVARIMLVGSARRPMYDLPGCRRGRGKRGEGERGSSRGRPHSESEAVERAGEPPPAKRPSRAQSSSGASTVPNASVPGMHTAASAASTSVLTSSGAGASWPLGSVPFTWAPLVRITRRRTQRTHSLVDARDVPLHFAEPLGSGGEGLRLAVE